MSSGPLLPRALFAKARTALASAQALLDLGDYDGVANRAYYAMFDAARAALLVSGAPVPPDVGRTHSGLIGAFGKHLVKDGPIAKDIGRLLNRAHEVRLLADYTDQSIELADGRTLVDETKLFLDAIYSTFSIDL